MKRVKTQRKTLLEQAKVAIPSVNSRHQSWFDKISDTELRKELLQLRTAYHCEQLSHLSLSQLRQLVCASCGISMSKTSFNDWMAKGKNDQKKA